LPKRRKLKKQEPEQKQEPQIDEVSYETSTIEEHANVLFRPNPGPQTEFLAASEREVLYGGSAGGGKSYAMLADPLRYMGHSQFSGLLLRHTTEELRELIFKSQELYPKIWPGIKWSERKMQWTAPSGARLWMSYLDRDEDVLRYQGLAFSWIGFDELTQWSTPYAWDYMRSRLRSTAPDLPIFMRATTNPGGRGHGWVKKMFIDPAPYNRAFDATNIETGEVLRYPYGHSKAGKSLFKRRFIPARLSDNPYLASAGDYEAMLLSLPEQQQLIVYRELYVSKILATDLADMILDLEAEDGNIKYGVLDSSLWHKRGDTGPSLAEQMINKGCRWRPSDRSRGSRVAGKNELHRRLQVDDFTEEPRLVFFNSCTNVVSQLPSIPLDKKNPEDVDTKSEDHLYDALRYGIMSRPRFSIFDYDPHGRPSTGMRIADSTFGY
jgi:hypothetical protein